MLFLIMGVTGSGKTTVGSLLASHLACPFADADDFHSPANKAKMAAGIPLTDADRAPWLAALRSQIEHWLATGQTAVLACSALKHAYQQQLTAADPRIRLVYLKGTPEQIAARLAHRHGHYAKADLLASQFATLEEPSEALTLSIAAPPETLVTQILSTL